jgi:spermidine synthase
MARKRAGKTAPSAPAGPIEGEFPIDTGIGKIEKDPFSDGGWLLWVNGVQSSHIADNPLTLEFEYMQWIAAAINDLIPDPAEKMTMLHLGGGACTLARWGLAAYPNSRHVVVEIDGKLADRVREAFDLPRAPLLRIRQGEARSVLETLTDGTRDVIIRDVFAGSATPRPLTTVEFLEHAKRVLTPGGLYIANVGDRPDLKGAKTEMATARAVFRHVMAIADPAMFKGRRAGNVILVASDRAPEPSAALSRELLGSGVPAQAWAADRVRAFSAGAEILRDVPAVEGD